MTYSQKGDDCLSGDSVLATSSPKEQSFPVLWEWVCPRVTHHLSFPRDKGFLGTGTFSANTGIALGKAGHWVTWFEV